MTETRRQIRRQVTANAGIHFSELVRRTSYARGQVQYHLRQLVDDGELCRDEFYGRTHFYPPTYDEAERAILALFRRETAREIVVYLLDHQPATPAAIVDDLEIARGTLEYHLDRLVEHGVVEKHYDRNHHVSLALTDPERTADLLSIVTPTVPDRLLDRFTRLVDDLLESP